MVGFEQDIAEAIRKIATKGILDKQGNLLAASETQGYVVKIHDDPNDILYGTVDVREYAPDTFDLKDEEEDLDLRGYHEGVFLTVIQNIENGVYRIPKLYADVTIVMDSITKREYVKECNQVDVINNEAGTRIGIGVIERQEYTLDDQIEHEEEEETGNKSWTEYTKDDVVTSVEGDDGSKATVTHEKGKVGAVIENGGDKVEVTATSASIEMKVCDKITITLKDGKITVEADDVLVNAKKVKVTGGQMEMAGVASTDMMGPFCAIPTCPFSGAPHNGKLVSNT